MEDGEHADDLQHGKLSDVGNRTTHRGDGRCPRRSRASWAAVMITTVLCLTQ